eukprot:477741-Prorocentrum_minimum.AAC.1
MELGAQGESIWCWSQELGFTDGKFGKCWCKRGHNMSVSREVIRTFQVMMHSGVALQCRFVVWSCATGCALFGLGNNGLIRGVKQRKEMDSAHHSAVQSTAYTMQSFQDLLEHPKAGLVVDGIAFEGIYRTGTDPRFCGVR